MSLICAFVVATRAYRPGWLFHCLPSLCSLFVSLSLCLAVVQDDTFTEIPLDDANTLSSFSTASRDSSSHITSSLTGSTHSSTLSHSSSLSSSHGNHNGYGSMAHHSSNTSHSSTNTSSSALTSPAGPALTESMDWLSQLTSNNRTRSLSVQCRTHIQKRLAHFQLNNFEGFDVFYKEFYNQILEVPLRAHLRRFLIVSLFVCLIGPRRSHWQLSACACI